MAAPCTKSLGGRSGGTSGREDARVFFPRLLYLPTCPPDVSPWLRRHSRGNEARILEHQFAVAVVNLRGYAATDTAHQFIQ